jgi:hypothetical protein
VWAARIANAATVSALCCELLEVVRFLLRNWLTPFYVAEESAVDQCRSGPCDLAGFIAISVGSLGYRRQKERKCMT